MFVTPVSCAMICWGAERDLDSLLGRERQRLLLKLLVCSDWAAAQHTRQSLDRCAHDVVQRLLSRQRHTNRLRIKRISKDRSSRAPNVSLSSRAQILPSRAVLRDLFKEVDVRVERFSGAGANLLHSKPRVILAGPSPAYAQRERKLPHPASRIGCG